MKHAVSISAILLALAITLPQYARANGPGGGHGGSGGGHGGSSGGHGSSGHGSGAHAGHSSGNSPGHSVGHAFAHIFGHHGKTSPASPKMVPRNPKWVATGQPIDFSPARRRFGSSPCWNNVFFPRSASSFNCFDNNFFFLDPFFFGSFSLLGAMPDSGSAYAVESGLNQEAVESGNNSPSANDANPVTLLQLLDGSMYGLTSYQVIGHDLHYTTTYGGQNSIPLDRIDFTQTLKLNAERQVPFLLEPKSTPN